MKSHPLSYMLILAVILLFGFGQAATVGAQSQTDNVAIAFPANGATVSGLITITGAVSFSDFLKYEIFLKPDKGELFWVATTYAPVLNGNLARFDTRTYLNGTYQMLIRQVNNDSNYTEIAGPTITIDNEQGAPQPYPEIEPNYLYPTENYALVRLKNCSGVNLDFDYNSPEGFHSADSLSLIAKGENTTYCPFEDFVLIPGEYRGSATGQGEKAFNYSFRAEVGKVYELIYNGEGAGRNQFLVNYLQGDKRAVTDTASGQIVDASAAAAPTQTPVPVAAAAVVSSQSVAEEDSAQAAPADTQAQTAPEKAQAQALPAGAPAQANSMLPATGQADASGVLFVLIATTLFLLVAGGSILALLWRRGFSI